MTIEFVTQDNFTARVQGQRGALLLAILAPSTTEGAALGQALEELARSQSALTVLAINSETDVPLVAMLRPRSTPWVMAWQNGRPVMGSAEVHADGLRALARAALSED